PGELPKELLQFLQSTDDTGLALLSKLFGESAGSPPSASSAQAFSNSLSAVLAEQTAFIKSLVSNLNLQSGGPPNTQALVQATNTAGPIAGNNAFINAVSTARAVGGSSTPLRYPSLAAGSTRTTHNAIIAPRTQIERAPASFGGTPHRDVPASQTITSPAFDKTHQKK
ncbi:MAG: hypothetical protein KDD51_09660, partial [Bdellovibrionales bacterium]|nr:hypothetical protein [Bdellovibrionales bacterium]